MERGFASSSSLMPAPMAVPVAAVLRINSGSLALPASPYQVMAGTVIRRNVNIQPTLTLWPGLPVRRR